MGRTLIALLAALALVASGCGGSDDDGGGSSGGAGEQAAAATPMDAADKFIGCFDKAGFEAAHPEEGQESLFALQVEKGGYEAVPVNVTRPNAFAADAYLVFFEDEATAKKARAELGVTAAGDAPPLERGQVIAGYLDTESKTELEPAITACL
jgi:hypothetical protein